MYRVLIKRIFDILIALCGLLIFSPIFLILLPILWFSNNGSIFFTQTRPGMNGQLFKILKLKTMNDKQDELGKLLPDKDRLTAIGKFIRSLSLDELPQFYNVLIGDMSFVGPRPLLSKYIPLYNNRQMRRHEVRPGITGWSQVNGRNTLEWKERLEQDVWYVEHLSWFLDLKIIFLTFIKVIKREGINASDAATMKPFKGNIE